MEFSAKQIAEFIQGIIVGKCYSTYLCENRGRYTWGIIVSGKPQIY